MSESDGISKGVSKEETGTESKRNVISEREILSVDCPICGQPAGRICRTPNRMRLPIEVGQSKFTFHPQRIIKAQDEQIKRLGFGDANLGPTEKGLILYYAFIMLCDSISTKSQELFGKEMDTQDLQRFFAKKAIEELRKDGLFHHGKTS